MFRSKLGSRMQHFRKTCCLVIHVTQHAINKWLAPVPWNLIFRFYQQETWRRLVKRYKMTSLEITTTTDNNKNNNNWQQQKLQQWPHLIYSSFNLSWWHMGFKWLRLSLILIQPFLAECFQWNLAYHTDCVYEYREQMSRGIGRWSFLKLPCDWLKVASSHAYSCGNGHWKCVALWLNAEGEKLHVAPFLPQRTYHL